MSQFWLNHTTTEHGPRLGKMPNIIILCYFHEWPTESELLKNANISLSTFFSLKNDFCDTISSYFWLNVSFFLGLLSPPLKKRLTFLWVSRRQIQRWMTDEFQIWMIQNPKFGINLKALDRGFEPCMRYWITHSTPPHQYSPIGSLRGKEASNANFLFSLHCNRLSFKIRISN